MYRFEKLTVWKTSSRLCADLYKALSQLKDFGFRDQITRSALSIPSNIAEGFERDSEKEKARFLKIAKGSAGEIRAQLFIGMEIGYIQKEAGKKWLAEIEEITKMLHAPISTINKST